MPERFAQHLHSGAEQGPRKTHQQFDQGGLSGPVRTQNKTALSAPHLPGNIVQDFLAAQVHPGVLHIDGRQKIVHIQKKKGFRGEAR